VQDAGDEGWGGVQESQVVFLQVKEWGARVEVWEGGVEGWGCPEDVVVVGKVGEEDSEEEADGCGGYQCGYFLVGFLLILTTND